MHACMIIKYRAKGKLLVFNVCRNFVKDKHKAAYGSFRKLKMWARGRNSDIDFSLMMIVKNF